MFSVAFGTELCGVRDPPAFPSLQLVQLQVRPAFRRLDVGDPREPHQLVLRIRVEPRKQVLVVLSGEVVDR